MSIVSAFASVDREPINCSEINDFHFVVEDGWVVACNKQILARASKFFDGLIESEPDATVVIDIPDWNVRTVETVISHVMALANKRVAYQNPVCDLKEAEQQIKFCHQYDLPELQTILTGYCCNSLNRFGKFKPAEMIRIGSTYHIDDLVRSGVDRFDVSVGNKEEFVEYILKSNNDVVKRQLILKSFSRYEKFISCIKKFAKENPTRYEYLSQIFKDVGLID